MMIERVILGALMIGALLSIVGLDLWLSMGLPNDFSTTAALPAGTHALRAGLPILVIALALTILASYELAKLLRHGHYKPAKHWAALATGLLVALPWIEFQSRLNGTLAGDATSAASILLAATFLGAALLILARRTTERAITQLAVTLLIVLYIGLLGSFFVRLRCLAPGPAGAAAVFLTILTIKAGDIGAYFTGRLIGKHPLASWLSPNKTIEGFFGALTWAALVALALRQVWGALDEVLGEPPLTSPQAFIFGIVMAILGHLGDLTESAIKRDIGAKHSGHLLPGFGGLLDLLDSPLLAAPVAWWLLSTFAASG